MSTAIKNVTLTQMHRHRRFSLYCWFSQSPPWLVSVLATVLNPASSSLSSSMCTAVENLFQNWGSRTNPMLGDWMESGREETSRWSGDGRCSRWPKFRGFPPILKVWTWDEWQRKCSNRDGKGKVLLADFSCGARSLLYNIKLNAGVSTSLYYQPDLDLLSR